MLRSMYSGISGMKANQTKLDVIGNNIANASTTAFKYSQATFKDLLSQTSKNATAPTYSQGGVNASEVGLGAQLGAITKIVTQGNLQSTNRALDLAIDQTGYFVVSNGPNVSQDDAIIVNQDAGAHTVDSDSLASAGSSLFYTRDGSFVLDSQGNLLTSDGYRVMGYSVTNDDSTKAATSISSSDVAINGLTVSFGPGSQLNGYKVVLGAVGNDTPTSANIDKNNKLIILNGDFSDVSDVTSNDITKAINKALDTAGISQSVSVTGTPTALGNLKTSNVSGGVAAEAPNSVTAKGYTFYFKEGDDANTYKVKFGSKTGAAVSAQKIGDSIEISGNYDVASTDDIKAAIEVAFPGIISSIGGSYNDGASAESAVISGGKKAASATDLNILGTKLGFSAGNELNGYKFVVGNINEGTETSATVNTGKKTITINGDFVSGGKVTAADIQAAVNKALTKAGINSTVTATGTPTTFSNTTSNETSGGTPVQSIANDGTVYFVDATITVNSYDSSLKALKIPDTITNAATGTISKVTGFTIGTDGVISATLEDQSVAALGQVALVSFKNPEGLTSEGSNLLSQSVNSGEAVFKSGVNTINDDNSDAFGKINSGYLEMSNVDLAGQFTDMITATRAFQASSKAITTGDEILQDIINLKR